MIVIMLTGALLAISPVPSASDPLSRQPWPGSVLGILDGHLLEGFDIRQEIKLKGEAP